MKGVRIAKVQTKSGLTADHQHNIQTKRMTRDELVVKAIGNLGLFDGTAGRDNRLIRKLEKAKTQSEKNQILRQALAKIRDELLRERARTYESHQKIL